MNPLKAIKATLLSVMFAAVSASAATIFTSPYDGQNPGNASDQVGVIGTNGQFDIQSLAFTNISSSNVTVQIDFNYNYGDTTLSPFSIAGITLNPGDLLLTNGSQMWGVALANHTGFTAGGLYSVDSFRTAKDVLGNPSATYNTNASVWMKNDSHQQLLAAGTVSTMNIGGDEVQTTLSFTPPSGFISGLTKGNVLVEFGSATCGNDYISGTVSTTVPEPTSMILLGTGLLGFGLIPRLRRRLK